MTMVWKSGTSRARRSRRLSVCTLATTVGAVCVLLALDHANGQPRGDELQLVHGLVDQFIAVRQDEGTAAALLHQQGKDNGFAGAGRQDQQGPLHPACAAASRAATASCWYGRGVNRSRGGAATVAIVGFPEGQGAGPQHTVATPEGLVRSILYTTWDCNRIAPHPR